MHTTLDQFLFYVQFQIRLSDLQSGFMKFYSCQSTLTDLIITGTHCLDEGNFVGASNVDLRKVFILFYHDI